MKKCILLFVLIFFFLTGKNFSQEKSYRFGFSFSPNVCWIKPDTKNYDSEGGMMGFSWGFLSHINMSDNYSIETGFNIAQVYGKLSSPYLIEDNNGNSVSTGTLNRKYYLKYFEIPVILRMQANNESRYKFFGQIGIGTSFNIRAKADDDYQLISGSVIPSETNVDIKDNITLVRESIIIGGGCSIDLNSATTLILGLNFNNGFIDILKGHNSLNNDKEQAYLNYFELNIGVLF